MAKAADTPIQIAVCFFGITRSLRHTLPSIETHVLDVARATGHPVHVYAHFFEQAQIDNPRTGETGALEQDEHKLLPLDQVALEAPGACLAEWDFEGLKSFGDFWGTDFTSLRNLVHQLHSLKQVTEMAGQADVVIFARPDLEYHDSMAKPLRAALRVARAGKGGVWLPWWQAWFGRNDRFAICAGAQAIKAYGTRVTRMRDFCETGPRPMHAEAFVDFVLNDAGVAVHSIGQRASRVRAGGQRAEEEFLHPATRKLLRAWWKLDRLSGLRALRHRLSPPNKTDHNT
ncbi:MULTISPECIES: hypothetical protein [Rhodobacterales]|uniref:hypothetical protein n=1 Tax=Rhodobacterales TaxID=204455 RepID=UPI003296A018